MGEGGEGRRRGRMRAEGRSRQIGQMGEETTWYVMAFHLTLVYVRMQHSNSKKVWIKKSVTYGTYA